MKDLRFLLAAASSLQVYCADELLLIMSARKTHSEFGEQEWLQTKHGAMVDTLPILALRNEARHVW